jgi:hypothetical protein
MSDSEILAAVKARRLSEGDVYFLCSPQWFKAWKEFAQNPEKNNPGPIITDTILEKNGELKPHLVTDYDFSIIHQAEWKILVEK